MRKGRWLCLIITVLAGFGMSSSLGAEEGLPKSYIEGSSRKLGRGLANVVTAPLELVRTPTLVAQSEGGLVAGTVGLVQGFWAALVRELAGIVEVATFFVPVPKDFQPLVRPEFIYAHGDWVP